MLDADVATVFERQADVPQVLAQGAEHVALLARAVEPGHSCQPAGVVRFGIVVRDAESRAQLVPHHFTVQVLGFGDELAGLLQDAEQVHAGQSLHGLAVLAVAELGCRFPPPAQPVQLHRNGLFQHETSSFLQEPATLALFRRVDQVGGLAHGDRDVAGLDLRSGPPVGEFVVEAGVVGFEMVPRRPPQQLPQLAFVLVLGRRDGALDDGQGPRGFQDALGLEQGSQLRPGLPARPGFMELLQHGRPEAFRPVAYLRGRQAHEGGPRRGCARPFRRTPPSPVGRG